jgi:hypothetical protein
MSPKGESKEGGLLPYFLKMTPRRGGIERNKDGLPALFFEDEPGGRVERNREMNFPYFLNMS